VRNHFGTNADFMDLITEATLLGKVCVLFTLQDALAPGAAALCLPSRSLMRRTAFSAVWIFSECAALKVGCRARI
jgi:hypothetical protein